ncbi:hypothetical protein [Demequina sp. NBRC 110052]|uniref:hypothetical protein n=1 Tax=Demequina sp. NBRC 110052 TaxID=1570341 RepID=UPI0009FC41A2|nr:hypothetical protein [Demequina sp. NBRC 110052]
MNASNWINLGIMLLTAIGVVVAANQARSARTSASQASGHERAALESARESAAAQKRVATALEESNELARSSQKKTRWGLSVEDKDAWRLTNQGPGSVSNVELKVLEADPGLVHSETFPKDELEEGLSGTFRIFRHMGMATDLTLAIAWDDPEAGTRVTVKTTLP